MMLPEVNNEVQRFIRLWESRKDSNPGSFKIILTMFIAHVDPTISAEVELKILENYPFNNKK